MRVGATAPNALSISPIRNEISVAAGVTYTSNLVIENSTDQSIGIDMYAQTFSVQNQSYDYSFHDSSSLNQWVRFSPSTFDLAAQHTQKVSYTIGVPSDATPGGKYFSLFAATTDKGLSNGIATSRRVGSLVYLTVPGDPSHKGELLGLNTPTIAFSPIDWSEKVNNTGANYFRSEYTVSLQTIWGAPVVTQKSSALVLSSSVRLVSGQLATPQWIGLYKVSANFSLGDNGTQTDSRWLVYLPLSQLAVIILIIISCILLVTRRRRLNLRTKD